MIDFLSLDQAGRVVIPKPIRDRYGLRAGQELELVDTGEELRLRPRREYATTEERPNGWIVFTDPMPSDFDAVTAVAEMRAEYSRGFLP
jgi:AbrB family looped-hinge helix DNA binding protein